VYDIGGLYRGSDRQSGNSALVSSSITSIGSTLRYELHVSVRSATACPKFAIASSHRSVEHSVHVRCITGSFATQGVGSVSGHSTLQTCDRFSSCVAQWKSIRHFPKYLARTMPILLQSPMCTIARFRRGSDRQSGNRAPLSSSITRIGSTSHYELHVCVGFALACSNFAIASSIRSVLHSVNVRCITRSFATRSVGSVSGHSTLATCDRFSSCVAR
jgi:hypothetical protein